MISSSSLAKCRHTKTCHFGTCISTNQNAEVLRSRKVTSAWKTGAEQKANMVAFLASYEGSCLEDHDSDITHAYARCKELAGWFVGFKKEYRMPQVRILFSGQKRSCHMPRSRGDFRTLEGWRESGHRADDGFMFAQRAHDLRFRGVRAWIFWLVALADVHGLKVGRGEKVSDCDLDKVVITHVFFQVISEFCKRRAVNVQIGVQTWLRLGSTSRRPHK